MKEAELSLMWLEEIPYEAKTVSQEKCHPNGVLQQDYNDNEFILCCCVGMWVYGSMHMCTGTCVEIKRCQVSLSNIHPLVFETGSYTEPGEYCFSCTDWSEYPQALCVFFSSAEMTDHDSVARLSFTWVLEIKTGPPV